MKLNQKLKSKLKKKKKAKPSHNQPMRLPILKLVSISMSKRLARLLPQSSISFKQLSGNMVLRAFRMPFKKLRSITSATGNTFRPFYNPQRLLLQQKTYLPNPQRLWIS
jgi:hypothetical protein